MSSFKNGNDFAKKYKVLFLINSLERKKERTSLINGHLINPLDFILTMGKVVHLFLASLDLKVHSHDLDRRRVFLLVIICNRF